MKHQEQTLPRPQDKFNSPPRPLATVGEVTDWLGVSRRTLNTYLLEGDFPQPIRGIGSPRWHWDTLEDWAQAGGKASATRRKRGRPRAGAGK